jgi:hypothetical protein
MMCHPEQGEGSRLHGKEILHSVQNDNAVDFATALNFK